MAKYYLVIVESPGKIKKLKSILGSEYQIVASMGHVMDLPPKSFGIKLDQMDAEYVVLKKDIAKRLRSEAQKSYRVIYLASDPDREGEAISWHLYELLKEQKALEGKDVHRVDFYEFTKNAIQKAVANPREFISSNITSQI